MIRKRGWIRRVTGLPLRCAARRNPLTAPSGIGLPQSAVT